MSELVERLRGIYRIPITDGLGPAGGEEPDNPNEFVRKFDTPPIQHEAAARIEALEAALAKIEWALTKQSLTDKERVQDALSVARRAREGGNADG